MSTGNESFEVTKVHRLGSRPQRYLTRPQTVIELPGRMLPMPIDYLLEQIGIRFHNQLERNNIQLNSLQK
jgi:hypothetical protein